MKKLYLPLVILSFFSSLILSSCHTQNVSEPSLEKTGGERLSKTITVSLDHVKDSVIILPKSKKELIISKKFPKDRIAELDNYLSKHKITYKDQNVIPNAPACNQYITIFWELQSKYKGVTGKYLGIWNNYVDWQKLHDTYGFRMLYVTSTSQLDAAHTAGFHYDSLMVGLSSYGTAFNLIDATNTGTKEAGYYYIDEPFEDGTWNTYELLSVEDYLYNNYPGEKLMMGSYKWPVSPQYYSFPITYGVKYKEVLDSYGNEYIMCDQYHGDCLGNTDEYWTKYRDYYGNWNCIMNWVHVVTNNGNGNDNCPYLIFTSNSWYDLLGDANENGVNKMWLYALSTGDENAIISFCNSAWQRGWLLRLKRELVIVYHCYSPQPCENCTFPDQGDWYITDTYYIGDPQWVSY